MEDTPQEPVVFKNRRTEWNFHRRNHLGQQSEHCNNRPDIWVQTTRSHHYFPPCKTEPSIYGFFRKVCGARTCTAEKKLGNPEGLQLLGIFLLCHASGALIFLPLSWLIRSSRATIRCRLKRVCVIAVLSAPTVMSGRSGSTVFIAAHCLICPGRAVVLHSGFPRSVCTATLLVVVAGRLSSRFLIWPCPMGGIPCA